MALAGEVAGPWKVIVGVSWKRPLEPQPLPLSLLLLPSCRAASGLLYHVLPPTPAQSKGLSDQALKPLSQGDKVDLSSTRGDSSPLFLIGIKNSLTHLQRPHGEQELPADVTESRKQLT